MKISPKLHPSRGVLFFSLKKISFVDKCIEPVTIKNTLEGAALEGAFLKRKGVSPCFGIRVISQKISIY
jgi:hypothetical protein